MWENFLVGASVIFKWHNIATIVFGSALGILVKRRYLRESISAILLKTPGTPAAAATVLDGYQLTKKGKSGKALKMAIYASRIADTLSNCVLIAIAPPWQGLHYALTRLR